MGWREADSFLQICAQCHLSDQPTNDPWVLQAWLTEKHRYLWFQRLMQELAADICTYIHILLQKFPLQKSPSSWEKTDFKAWLKELNRHLLFNAETMRITPASFLSAMRRNSRFATCLHWGYEQTHPGKADLISRQIQTSPRNTILQDQASAAPGCFSIFTSKSTTGCKKQESWGSSSSSRWKYKAPAAMPSSQVLELFFPALRQFNQQRSIQVLTGSNRFEQSFIIFIFPKRRNSNGSHFLTSPFLRQKMQRDLTGFIVNTYRLIFALSSSWTIFVTINPFQMWQYI